MKYASTLLAIGAVIFLTAADKAKTYRWVDDNGVVHFGDSVPPEYAEKDKVVVNQHGVHVGFVKGKITDEEKAEMARQEAEKARQAEIMRQNQVLMATYLTVDEIRMHRDRRIELVKAQAKVANLYLNNLQMRLSKLQLEANNYRPYSNDPDAPPVPLDLAEAMEDTKARIKRYEGLRDQNLKQERDIKERFEKDIKRFESLRVAG